MFSKKGHRFENLSEEEYETFINLQSNKNIIIQKADQGNSAVIIYHFWSVNKVEKLLSDSSKFVEKGFNTKQVNQDIRYLLDIKFESLQNL